MRRTAPATCSGVSTPVAALCASFATRRTTRLACCTSWTSLMPVAAAAAAASSPLAAPAIMRFVSGRGIGMCARATGCESESGCSPAPAGGALRGSSCCRCATLSSYRCAQKKASAWRMTLSTTPAAASFGRTAALPARPSTATV